MSGMNRLHVRALLATVTAATIAALAVAPAADAAMPCLLTEATRIKTTRVNLDKDRSPETISVYNLDATGAPVSMFQVCDTVKDELVQIQRVTVNESPGARDSGLRGSWVGRLSHGTRVEIAVRDYFSPSAGEVLSIYRQNSRYSRTFKLVQRIPGDVTILTRVKDDAAVVRVQLKANHARDGKAHAERWTYDAGTAKWACTSDCGGR